MTGVVGLVLILIGAMALMAAWIIAFGWIEKIFNKTKNNI